jgi:hypothetical protein
MPEPAADILRRARLFVREDAGFAQVTTIDRLGFPVGRSMTAFLEDDWSVSLVQRRVHARLAQLRRNPHALVTWVGEPAPGATNERPHVFDLGRLPSRAVFVRGSVAFMDERWTEHHYREQIERQRALGFVAAPLRTPEQVGADLVGVRLEPVRIRLEGFGTGAEAFDWDLTAPDHTGGTP